MHAKKQYNIIWNYGEQSLSKIIEELSKGIVERTVNDFNYLNRPKKSNPSR